MWSNPQFPADLTAFTEEILDGKLHFLSIDFCKIESLVLNETTFHSSLYNKKKLVLIFTAWKVSKYRVFSGPYFPTFGLNMERYFSPNAGKYEPEKTPYLDTFHGVIVSQRNIQNILKHLR